MQRRAGAMYFVFFLVVGLGALALTDAAGSPERVNGLLGVTIVSISAAVILLGGAYLPSKG